VKVNSIKPKEGEYNMSGINPISTNTNLWQNYKTAKSATETNQHPEDIHDDDPHESKAPVRGGAGAGAGVVAKSETPLTEEESVYDIDGDGVLSASERAAMLRATVDEMSASSKAQQMSLINRHPEDVHDDDPHESKAAVSDVTA
jgi:hypothetical protein